MYAWSKYKKAVIWAFPHRADELMTYEEHIIDLFNSDFDPLYCIGYDQAAQKFLHEINTPSPRPTCSTTFRNKSSSPTQQEGELVDLRCEPPKGLAQPPLKGENESKLGMTQTYQSARSSTSPLDVNSQTASTTTSAQTAIQAATPISNALKKAKRKVKSKDPEYKR